MDEIFRTGVSLTSFCRLFLLHNPLVLRNKARRWKQFIHATCNGTLFDRPRFNTGWQTYRHYEQPIWHRLQSSYDDVAFELETIRTKLMALFPGIRIVFVAGDGLSLMRVNMMLNNHDWLYLERRNGMPLVIPVQGEHPHGQFHAMHCMLRLYKSFVDRITDLIGCSKQITTEPSVSKFNVHRFFFLNVLTRACSEYLVEIGNTPGADDLDDPLPVVAKAARNVDLEWVVHFLYDAGYYLLDFVQCVRANESRTIDILWREFFASAHTDTAHKTQCVPMAILRVFWGMVLSPELDELYHKIRTAPTDSEHPGSNVGWDMLIEWLNRAIKSHVTTHITEAQIEEFLRNWPFMETVRGGVRDFVYAARTFRDFRWRDVDGDVEKILAFLRKKVGKDWAAATKVNSVPHILKAGESTKRPWKEIQGKMDKQGAEAPHVFVRNVVNRYTSFFQWQP